MLKETAFYKVIFFPKTKQVSLLLCYIRFFLNAHKLVASF